MIPTVDELAQLRTRPQSTDLALAVYHPATVFTGRVAGDPAPGALTVDLSDGNLTGTVHDDYTVWVGSTAASHDKGKLRLRQFIGGGIGIKVGQNAKDAGMVQWSPGDYVTILEDVELYAILPSIDVDIDGKTTHTREDTDREYGVENTQQHPLNHIGGPPVRVYRGVAEVFKFYALPDAIAAGAIIAGVEWTFPGCSPSSFSGAGSKETPIEIMVNTPGHYWISCTATDDNGQSHVRYTPLMLLAEGDPGLYLKVHTNSIDSQVASPAAEYNLSVYETASETDFPKEGYCVLFADKEYYGTSQLSIGGNHAYRENVVAHGRIVSGTVHINKDFSSVDFTLASIISLMQRLTVWPVTILSDPAEWHKIPSCTPDLAAFHILTEHSTLDHIADFYLSGYQAKSFDSVALPEQSLYEQLNGGIYSAIRATVLADRQGIIRVAQNPQLMTLVERAAVNTVMALQYTDLRGEPTLGQEESVSKVAQLDFISFYYGGPDGHDPIHIYSLAPGSQRPYGTVERVDGIRADNQDEGNVLSGLYDAWMNGDLKDVTLPLAGNWRIFDIVPREYVLLPFTANLNGRRLDFSQWRWLVNGVTLNYDSKGFILADLHVERETYGPPGITGAYPGQNQFPGLRPLPIPRCPLGQYYNPVSRQCERINRCPPGTLYNPYTLACDPPAARVLPPTQRIILTALGVNSYPLPHIHTSWTVVPSVTGYKLERSLNGTTGWTLIATLPAAAKDDAAIFYNTRYYYRVRAYNAGGNGPYSNVADAIVVRVVVPVRFPFRLVMAMADRVIELADAGGFGYTIGPATEITGNLPGGLTGFGRDAVDGGLMALTPQQIWKRTSGAVWVAAAETAQQLAMDSDVWTHGWYDEDGTGTHGHAVYGKRGVDTTWSFPCDVPHTGDFFGDIHWGYLAAEQFTALVFGNAVLCSTVGNPTLRDCSNLVDGFWRSLLTGPEAQPFAAGELSAPDLAPAVLGTGGIPATLRTHFSAYDEVFHHFGLTDLLYLDGADVTAIYGGAGVFPYHYTDSNGHIWAWETGSGGSLWKDGVLKKSGAGGVAGVQGLNAPPDTTTRYAISYDGDIIFKSIDDGESWTDLPSPPGITLANIFTVPGHAEKLIAVDNQASIWFSADDGANWWRIFAGPCEGVEGPCTQEILAIWAEELP